MKIMRVRHMSSVIARKIESLGQLSREKTCGYATFRRILTNLPNFTNIGIRHTQKAVKTANFTSHRVQHNQRLDSLGSRIKGKQLSNLSPCSHNCIQTRRSLSDTTISSGYSRTEGSKDGAISHERVLVLGIETSCDDTGAAVVDQDGRVVGEALNSQTKIHMELGGIIPYVARDLHRQNIENVVQDALCDAGISLQDLDAIACSVKPGLPASLEVGTKYAKKLVKESGKPFIPIHHMEAHALTARMIEPIAFPFLLLLASGGHCLLAVARDVDDFLLLGTCLDDAPGDAYDKTARALKLKNVPECAGLSGGAAVERMALGGDPHAFPLTTVMSQQPSCDFSFAGIKACARQTILAEEAKHGVSPVEVLRTAADVCATFQLHVLHHLAKRVQRALLYCEMTQLLPHSNKTMVVSGGVGSNMFLRAGLQRMCDHYGCTVVCPPPHLCTDNGIMVAWNGVEKWKVGRGVAVNPDTIVVQGKSPLGQDIREEVEKCSIKLKTIKLI